MASPIRSCLPGACLLLVTFGCQSAARLHRALERVRPSTLVEQAGGELDQLQGRVRGLVEDGVARGARLPDRTNAHLRRLADNASRAPGRSTATVRSVVAGRVRDVGRLSRPGSTLRQALAPESAARRLRHAVTRVPAVLGLQRPILPGPTDPNRRTRFGVATERESWLQRLMHRVDL